MSNQKFHRSSKPAVSGPKTLPGIPSKDSMVKPRHVMASKNLSNAKHN